MEIFAKRLRELREERGITKQKLGEEIGTSGVSIGYYERGERVPDIDVLAKLAELFEVTSDYLIGITDYRENKDMSVQLRIAEAMRGALCTRRHVLGLGSVIEVTEELWLKIADAVEGKCGAWQEKWN